MVGELGDGLAARGVEDFLIFFLLLLEGRGGRVFFSSFSKAFF